MPEQVPLPPEQLGWWLQQKIEQLEVDSKAAHARLEAQLAEVLKRLVPLEQLRAMVIGAMVVVVALTPLLWWLLTKAVQVAEKVSAP